MSMLFFARNLVMSSCLLVAIPAGLFGQGNLVPQGTEYAIAGALAGDQTFPQAAIDVNGGYLVWQDNAVTTLGLRIKAERLGSDLTAAGAPFVVSSASKSKATGDQEKPQVAQLPNGGAVIVWQGGKAGSQQIYARFLDVNGSFIKNDIRVGAHAKNNQRDPAVAALADGSVVVVWSSDGQDDAQNTDLSLRRMQGIYGQRFSASGAKLGGEFQINQWIAHNQRNPVVAALANGDFVVVWISELQRGTVSVDVYARIFTSSGMPAGSGNEFPVNTDSKICANPAVAGSAQGGFAVVWIQNSNLATPTPALSSAQNINGIMVPPAFAASVRSTDSWDVFGCLFDATGTNAITAPFRVNSYTYGDQFSPTVCATGSNYVAVWSSLNQTNSLGQVDPREGVFGQMITSGGGLVFSADMHVNTTTVSRQIQPAIAADGANRILTVWSSFIGGGANFDLFAQTYLQSTP